MMRQLRRNFVRGAAVAAIGASIAISFATSGEAAPTDNPVATFYSGEAGYPAWTDRIAWDNVIDMSAYEKGKTNFEKFENARDELAAAGGGVLYYPAGQYDFSDGPFDGPDGRGLMLKSGVVIRGEAPQGKPLATKGELKLLTTFVFGFEKRGDAVDTGERFTVELEGGDVRQHRVKAKKKKGEPAPPDEYRIEYAPLVLSFAADGGKIQPEVKAFRRGYGREVWPGKARISQSGDSIKLSVELAIDGEDGAGKAAYEIQLHRDGEELAGDFQGKCRDQNAKGAAVARFHTVTPETPRDWNLIGLMPEKGQRIKDVNTVGICWVNLVGGVVWFGPDIAWGDTWATADSWKSPFTLRPWTMRRPDGTHPWDPFAGGKQEYVGMGDGRLVFGCRFDQSCAINDMVTMGRPDFPEGFGEDGYYMHKFGPRIGAYGSRVYVANNLLPLSRGRNFKYPQTTRHTYPAGGHAAGYDSPRKSVILFDYNKTMGIDINKDMLGYTKTSATGEAGAGYFAPGVAVIDNYVYNNGHKGYNISGDWVTIARNHNERDKLREGYDPERICGWELTLDGHLETSPGGPGYISDNLSRGFDLGGRNLWAHENTFNNLGSSPGNDGEGILCQAHGGTQVYSWAITHNDHEQGDGNTSYIGGWDVNMAGVLFGWNKTSGWVGSINVGQRDAADAAFVGNECSAVKPMRGSQEGFPGGKLTPPRDVTATAFEGDAVRVAWKDASDNEVGFRVDRKIGEGPWTAIAYRPPQIAGDEHNQPVWIDYLAPTGRPLSYRVVALDDKDNDHGASEPAGPVTLQSPQR